MAAENNLVLVTDSYTQGIKSIIDLLDAQNKYLVAKQSAANSIFGFAVDLVSLQRSMGRYILLLEEDGNEKFKAILENGGSPEARGE